MLDVALVLLIDVHVLPFTIASFPRSVESSHGSMVIPYTSPDTCSIDPVILLDLEASVRSPSMPGAVSDMSGVRVQWNTESGKRDARAMDPCLSREEPQLTMILQERSCQSANPETARINGGLFRGRRRFAHKSSVDEGMEGT